MHRYGKSNLVYVSLLVILLLSQVAINFRSASHHNDELAEIWGSELLNSLRPNSILILCASSNFHLYYLQLIKGLREDVILYDRFSLWTKENLYAPNLLFKMQDRPREYRAMREQQLVNNPLRPIYYTCKDAIDENKFPFTFTPYVLRADRRHLEASDHIQLPVGDRFLDSVVNGYPKSDYWLDLRRKGIFSRLISYYGGHNRPEVDKIIDYFKKTKLHSNSQFLLSVGSNLYYLKITSLREHFMNGRRSFHCRPLVQQI